MTMNSPEDLLRRCREFSENAVKRGVNGLDFQHVAICERRCWLHRKRTSFNAWSDLIRSGQVLHDDLHRRDSSADGLVGLAPDRIDWDSSTVMENKSSASAFEASADQTAFYAILLSAATGRAW